MQVTGGGNNVHHHGLLAGTSAGAAGVAAAFGLLLMAWRAISRAVGVAGTVIVWALTAFVVAAAAYGVIVLALRVRHHVAHPETLMRQSVRAEVIPAQAEPAAVPVLPAAKAAAALPPGVPAAWRVLPQDPDEAIAMIRTIAGQQ
jgi:nitrate reductase gamma subunit